MEEPAPKPQLTTSQFYLWRSLISIAWADGSCGKEETAYFAKVFDSLERYYTLTQEQSDTLADALESENQPPPAELWAHINEPEPRRLLVLFAEDLVMLDGVIDPSEEEILKRLKLWDHPDYDVEQLQKDVHKIVTDARAQRAKEKQELRDQIRHMSPLYNAVDRLLMKLGIDLIE